MKKPTLDRLIPTIDKEIPIPLFRSSFPFRNMEVGDSFFTKVLHVRAAAHDHGKRFGKKFTTRAENDGVRVWRIE